MWTTWDLDSVGRTITEFLTFSWGLCWHQKWVDNHHGQCVHLYYNQPFSWTLARNFFQWKFYWSDSVWSEASASQCLSILKRLNYCMRSLLQGMELYFCSILPSCNTVPMSLLSEDIVHIQQYPQLEIHSQILLPLLWSWRGQHCCLKVSSNEE